MLHYHLTLGEVNELTAEQQEYLLAGLQWWGLVKTVNPSEDNRKWDQLRGILG